MKLRILIIWIFGFLPLFGLAQSCFTFIPTGDTLLPCNTNCFTLKAKIPDLKSTEDYVVQPIPYAPFPYRTAGAPITLNSTNPDDRYTDSIVLPFDFCFFGTMYTKCVIGTNGIVSFENANANKFNNYTLLTNSASAGLPTFLPYNGGGAISNTSVGTTRYPRASIFGCYYDIFPRNADNSWKIEARTEGIAPCRKYVVSFDHIAMFRCNTEFATFQMVLHENSAIIEIFIQDRPICSAWNDGRAIVGLQNFNRDYAVTPPGRNNTNSWGGNGINEGWRFTPSGSNSRFKRVELYLGNTLVATGDTTILGNGELGVSFDNVCPSQPVTNYRVVAYYTNCSDAFSEHTAEGTITVSKGTGIPVTTVVVPGSCSNSGVGTITVSPAGAGYEYSTDGINWQTSNVFARPVGSYNIRVREGFCKDSSTAVVPLAPPFTMSMSAAAAKCFGSVDGLVTITTAGGTTPFQYSSDGGGTYQSSNIFNLRTGSYIIRVRDANNCTKDSVITILQPDSIKISAQPTAAFCSGTADGKITVTASDGTPGYTYSLGGTIYQPGNVLAANVGSYTVFIKDANNCIQRLGGVVVPLNDTMLLSPLRDTTLCLGSSMALMPNTNATQFAWSPPAGLNSNSAGNPVASPADTITYFLNARLGTLCSRNDTFTINVLKPPIPNAGTDTTICYDTEAQLHATAIRGKTYRWTPATGLNNPNIPNPLMTLVTTTIFTVAVTDPYNCGFIRTDDVTVTVRPKVKAYAGQDTTATLGTPVQLFGCCMNLYQWSPSFIFQDDTARNPIGNFPAGTNQIIMLTTTPEGCAGKDTVIVKAYLGPDYYVPTGFSPGNRDGRNDVFRPIPVGIEETFFFNVYNRYGQLVFSTKTFFEGWDGTHKGILQPEGAYVWMVKGRSIEGKIVEKKGTVMLVRN
ncbi:MAG: gliding motility-associated C-terminal domain-containing protein [Bacteroidota bacterium]